jgi:phosphoribosylformimino-5-aminoimidazole carboxamide ribotide isomerase
VILYPAIDLRGGRCVRLRQGDYALETVYGDDPVAQARAFVDAGAEWIHVVDLDGALTGEPANRAAIAAIAAAVPIPVQASGGVRAVDDARELADAGVARVVLGTAAIERPELVDEVAPVVAVALGLDVRGREVAVRGWTQEYGSFADVLARFAGRPYDALVVTQIEVDGLGTGPDLVLYRELLDQPLIASGGVGSLDDLRALADLDVDGVIVGRAIYEQAFTVEEALAACTSPG